MYRCKKMIKKILKKNTFNNGKNISEKNKESDYRAILEGKKERNSKNENLERKIEISRKRITKED